MVSKRARGTTAAQHQESHAAHVPTTQSECLRFNVIAHSVVNPSVVFYGSRTGNSTSANAFYYYASVAVALQLLSPADASLPQGYEAVATSCFCLQISWMQLVVIQKWIKRGGHVSGRKNFAAIQSVQPTSRRIDDTPTSFLFQWATSRHVFAYV
ncbi:hypothetical protein EYZ11_011658 [Aspergillus tanneri]|uniref:Uncharacterized protein n=1 Tax=Aspergillus tanneri TaxID=1220188 RepID=A0A4S3J2J3_9EURO|nr:hypothetical protein EYZ11_011658 [Aspergillus tanneri]